MKVIILIFFILISCTYRETPTIKKGEINYKIIYQIDTCFCEDYYQGFHAGCISPKGIKKQNCAEIYCGQVKVEKINDKDLINF